MVLCIVYIPFAVVGLKIAHSPYSQCLDYVKVLNTIHRNGDSTYSGISIRYYISVIAVTCAVLIGVLLLFIISSLIWIKGIYLFLVVILIELLCLMKPVCFGVFLFLELYAHEILDHHCPSSLNAYFIVFMIENIVELIFAGVQIKCQPCF